MAQKSKKSKSKRMSLKQKYKIVKKVKEHHKKKAKEEKKLGKKRVPPKDPGIPNQWPFKAELLKELDWEKKRAVAEDKRRKEERKRARVCHTPKTFLCTVVLPLRCSKSLVSTAFRA